MPTHHLAIDLGAESGRLMLGTLADERLTLEEIHRFPNTPIQAGTSLHWNVPRLFEELRIGLKKAAERNLTYDSISTDSWGLDYMLFAPDGSVIEPTFHYRDPRTAHGVSNVNARVDWKTVFRETGIQFMPMNTIYQLKAEQPERLQRAQHLLMIGDAVNYWLSGVARAEVSLASTSQLYNPRTKAWSLKLLDALHLRADLFPPIIPSGTKLGPLKAELARDTGLNAMDVIATCSHDTGAAVVAVPAHGTGWAFISSGTWSLMGMERKSPVITGSCRDHKFSNEIGHGGSVRLLKNIAGLWLVQECRRAWARAGQELDYATLTRMAAEAPPFVSLIYPNDPRFVAPDDMPGQIAAFCRETGQPEPSSPGATIRCVLESLALLYAHTEREFCQVRCPLVRSVQIVGGGSRNELLNQFTANARQHYVEAGPVEATAVGNVIIQAITLGHLPSLKAARWMVRKSFELKLFEPRDRDDWAKAGERFGKLCPPIVHLL